MTNSKKAISLAETLIVMAVLGIIAVITISVLMKDYVATQLRSGFLVATSIVTNTSALLIQDDINIENLQPAEIVKYFKTSEYKANGRYANKYKTYKGTMNTSQAGAIIHEGEFPLENGMTGMIYYSSFAPVNYLIAIDVNGKGKKPDKYGHDVFFWYQNKKTGQLEYTGSDGAKRDLNGQANICLLNSDSGLAENGVGCGVKAFEDANWFKKLPH